MDYYRQIGRERTEEMRIGKMGWEGEERRGDRLGKEWEGRGEDKSI